MGISQNIRQIKRGDIYVLTQDTFGNPITASGGAMNVNVVTSVSGGATDKQAFTYGTNMVTAIAGVYNDVGATVASGTEAAARITAFRALHTNLRDSSGNEFGITGNEIKTKDSQMTAASAGEFPLAPSATSQVLLPQNLNRKHWSVTNYTDAMAWISIKSTASSGSFMAPLQANGFYESTFNYTGVLSVISDPAFTTGLIIPVEYV